MKKIIKIEREKKISKYKKKKIIEKIQRKKKRKTNVEKG